MKGRALSRGGPVFLVAAISARRLCADRLEKPTLSIGQHALEIDALMHGRARLGAVYVDSDNRIAVALYKGTADRFLIFGRALVLAVAGVPKVQHEESSPVAVYWLQSFPRNN